ncbi:MAG: carboxypeptidase-like regulatory domain-containing protein, partial [bacterium]|nr:carboxypeptidase-like regulatory domain-containing protein [bacterium]
MKNSWWFVFILVLGLCLSPGCGNGDRNPGASSVSSLTSDTTPPVIYEIGVLQQEDAVKVKWLTDEPATSQVQYGASSKTGFLTEEDKALVTKHEVTIDSLEKGVAYYLKAISRDANANPASSKTQVVALSQASDTTPPVIPNVTLEEKPLGSISGKITPTSVKAFISANQGGMREGSDWADADGNYKIEDLMEGTYTLVVNVDGFSPAFIWDVEVIGGKDIGGQDITLKLKPLSTAGSISGVITPPSSRARVHVLQNGEEVTVELTDKDDGTYHIWNLKEGLYDLEVTSAYGYYSDTSMVNIQVVAGEESPDQNVTLTLISTGSISGKISPFSPDMCVSFDVSYLSVTSDYDYRINSDGSYTITPQHLRCPRECYDCG